MNSADAWASCARRVGILVDSNLLVLLVVGSVNRKRIGQFKRTSSFVEADFDLLRDLLGNSRIFSLAHVLGEVSNLTDLSGAELSEAREVLKRTINSIEEPSMPSLTAVQNLVYARLGLTDAAIVESARTHGCAVLTNDLDLTLALQQQNLPAANFTHYRASILGL
ncbi:MAG: hypothetical protein C0504_11780 [Candidatus Solibacter sp.]|nr:hypothetical protein [Candidatus Solibacter sp.]